MDGGLTGDCVRVGGEAPAPRDPAAYIGGSGGTRPMSGCEKAGMGLASDQHTVSGQAHACLFAAAELPG